MEKNSIAILLLLLVSGADLWGQGSKWKMVDSIPADTHVSVYELKLNIPVGQTFVGKSNNPGYSRFMATMADQHMSPAIQMDTFPGGHISAHFSCESIHQQNQKVSATYTMDESGKKACSYTISRSTSISDPHRYLWEVQPSPKMPVRLNMNNGIGSARLDLSGLMVEEVNIFSAASDIILSYSEENKMDMESMNIIGGMSKIVLRNIGMARAREVRIENGMGTTRIFVGESNPTPTMYQILVGAGSCTIAISDNTPARIILNDSFISSIELPDNFVETSPNVYVNHAYQGNMDRAITFAVDIGLGNLSMHTINQ